MRIPRFVVTCLVPALVMCGLPLDLQPASAITLHEALQLAVEKSETARIVEQSAEVTRADARKSTAFIKPQSKVSIGYFRLGTNAPEFPGFEHADEDVIGNGQISQLLFAGGRIWRSLDLKESLYDQADFQYRTGIRDLRQEVKLAFVRVLFQNASLDILKDRLTQRKEELEDAKDLREAGMVTSLDVRQATLSLHNAVDELRSGEASYHELLVDFNVTIGRSGNEELLVPSGKLNESEKVSGGLRQLDEAFLEGALLNIKAAEQQYVTARLNHQLARGEVWPALQAVASGESHSTTKGGIGDTWNVGVQVSWDFLDGGLIRARKASTKAEMVQAENESKRVKKDLAGTIETLKVNADSLAERISLQRETVSLSAENYEDARGHYRAGTITQTRLGEFNLAYAEARFNLLRLYFLEYQLLIQVEALLE